MKTTNARTLTPLSTQARAFADACYLNALDELTEALTGTADPWDCRNWRITPEEWRAAIETTIAERRAILLDKGLS